MKALGGFGIALLTVSGLVAQNRSGFVNQPVVRSYGSVVFPGGTSAMPGVQRTFGSVVFPGGGCAQIGVPAPNSVFAPRGNGAQPFGRPASIPGQQHRGGAAVYAYPVYVGGYGYPDNSYLAEPTQQASPSVTIIMPPQPPPVIINTQPAAAQPVSIYPPQAVQPPVEEPQAQAALSEPLHYLIAFKDHTIYSAIAYWVEGDTLHYFTSGNTHNQVSVSLIDRELTNRLNKDAGVEIKLPVVK